MLGNGRLEAQCFDGEKRLAHIRGKMRKKVCRIIDAFLRLDYLSSAKHRCGSIKGISSYFPYGISKTTRQMSSLNTRLMRHEIVRHSLACTPAFVVNFWFSLTQWKHMENYQRMPKLTRPTRSVRRTESVRLSSVMKGRWISMISRDILLFVFIVCSWLYTTIHGIVIHYRLATYYCGYIDVFWRVREIY